MIPVTAASAAIAVAQEFDRRQLVLDATPGTPLAQLNEFFAFSKTNIAGVATYDPTSNGIATYSNNYSSDFNNSKSTHTTDLESLAKDIAGFVRSHLNFAKNTVRPLIEELVIEIKADIESLPLSAEYSAEIVVSDLPEPMRISSFEDSVMEYKNVDYTAITTYMTMPSLTGPEIVDKMVTGNSATDKEIVTWAAKKGDSFFQHIWDAVFTSTPTSNRFDSLVNDPDEGVDAAVAIYLLAMKLFDNPLEGTAQSLAAYNKQMADIRNQAALRIVHAYEEYVRYKTTGLLVKSSINNKVVVVGDTYRKWMEEGGNNAVLFGSMLSSNPEKFATDINTRKGDFLQAWERQNWMLTVAERNKRFVHYKEILKNRTLKVVADNYQQCYGHLCSGCGADTHMPEYTQFQKNLDDFVMNVTEGDFTNLWTLAQNTICCCVFYYTDSGKILAGIERACKENPSINVREAALISTIEYVADYVCDQITLSSV